MSPKNLVAHHFIANLTTRQYGSNPTSDLLGVDYWIAIPEERELPIRLERIDLFTRFYLQNVERAIFRVELATDSRRGDSQETVSGFGPYDVSFRNGSSVADHVFRMSNVVLNRVGMFTVRLYRRRKSRFRGIVWRPLCETHFYLVQT